MYDLSTSTETQITTGKSEQYNPAIYEDKIVLEDDRHGSRDIYMTHYFRRRTKTKTTCCKLHDQCHRRLRSSLYPVYRPLTKFDIKYMGL